MVKYFCDICGKETNRNYVTDELRKTLVIDNRKNGGFKYRTAEILVIVFINGIPNDCICKECLFKLINDGVELDNEGNISENIQ